MSRIRVWISLGVVLLLCGLCGILIFRFTRQSADTLHIDFLNVGQGDATFITTPDRYQILIDGGPDRSVLSELGRVMYPWDRTIDMVIATHPDADHIAGLIAVFDRYRIATVVAPGHPGVTQVAKHYWESVTAEQSPVVGVLTVANKTQTYSTPDGVRITVMHPQALGIHPTETNENSLLIRVDYADRSLFIGGDISSVVESRLVNVFPQYVDVDILKVSHHGSRFSSGESFLKTVSPYFAVISVGCDNTYGHPAPQTVERLRYVGIPFDTTCQAGRIRVDVDSQGNIERKR